MDPFFYWFIKKFVTLALFGFFRDVRTTGRSSIPRGPVIFAANHPNMILDPLLVAFTCGRSDSHFWAKAPLFVGPIGWILRKLGAVPVQRSQDVKTQDSKSPASQRLETLFNSSYTVLEKEECLVIFPEGTSYTEPHILPLKTGIARLVVGLAKKSDGKLLVPIVPVGLNYIVKDKWRSSVLIQYGQPINISLSDLDDEKVVDHLTNKLEMGLTSVTINAPTWEALKILDTGW
eukprot:TRINITY_DN2156_c0_g1_i1.p1 TRINITY_DN2156_c0_g1~~TRINITY_DN2156_c0_g1_i1.p1  ORF type:complete len:233 (+),score=25.36 TRINITY_DN2156_c0_g1_i1:56-754(+)